MSQAQRPPEKSSLEPPEDRPEIRKRRYHPPRVREYHPPQLRDLGHLAEITGTNYSGTVPDAGPYASA
jgi:hypothetical protein